MLSLYNYVALFLGLYSYVCLYCKQQRLGVKSGNEVMLAGVSSLKTSSLSAMQLYSENFEGLGLFTTNWAFNKLRSGLFIICA